MSNWLASSLAIVTLAAAACGGAAVGPAASASSSGAQPLGSSPTAPSVPSTVSSTAPMAAVTTPAASVVLPGPSAVARPLRASALGAELTAVGLEPDKLPPLASLTREQLNKVMSTFTKSTGLGCRDCHGSGSMTVETPHKRLARHMWNDFVRGLALKEGGGLYCDSCHQGRAKYLDHTQSADGTGEKALGAWMNSEFVQRLVRTDRKPHACATCHGTPFKGVFLEAWKAK